MEGELMAYEEIKSSGVTAETPQNILLGAGTIHKGLKYDTTLEKWNFEESIIGATSGGSKLKIEPDITDVEIDGANVKVKGLAVKIGEKASLETNIAELTPDVMKMAVLGEINASTDITGYSEIRSKSKIEAGDFVTGLGYIGKTIEGTPIIVIFDNALCTSGLELDGKKKDAAAIKATFECYADLTGDLEKLPYHIYYPTTYGA